MNIDFANLKTGYQEHKQEIDNAVSRVFESAEYIMGPHVKAFEQQLRDFTGTAYALTCSSGTDALLLALMATGVRLGDEVITTPFTFIATAETIALLGAKPVFVDIEAGTYNIDSSKIRDKITAKTKTIVPVSLFGQPSDMDEIDAIAANYGLTVIEDAAQSFGATYKGKKSCNLSHIGCTSFFPAKPLGCFGDGGAVFTNDERLAKKIDSLRLHGQTKRYHHKYIGIGGRLDALQAAILNVKLKYYQNDIWRRQHLAMRYHDLLEDMVAVPMIKKDRTSVWAQYSIRIKNRDIIQRKLKEKGIPTAVHYALPLHLQECFRNLQYKKGDFPIAENVSEEILSLPMNPFLEEKEQEYIATQLKRLIE